MNITDMTNVWTDWASGSTVAGGNAWRGTGYAPSSNINFSPPPPQYVFNIVILANGKSVALDSDELSAKIGKAIAAAMATRDAQELVEDLAE